MKKYENKSHLRPANRVTYFTYSDLEIIPRVLDKCKGELDTGLIFSLNLLQSKIDINCRKYERVRERTRINKRRRELRKKKEEKLNGE